MKTLIKKLSYVLILLVTTFFSSCEKDLYEDAIHSSKKIKIREVTFDKLIKEEKFNRLLSSTNDNITSRSAFENYYGFTISNEYVKVIEKDSITSYTIAIKRDGVVYNAFFENLVIQEDIYNTKKAAIYKYIPTEITPTGHSSFIFEGEIEKSTITLNSNFQNSTQSRCFAQHLMCCESWTNPGTAGTPHQATAFCQNINFLYAESFEVVCAPDNGGFENSGGGGDGFDPPFGDGPTPSGGGGPDENNDNPNVPPDYQAPDIITTPVLDNENYEDIKRRISFYQSLTPEQKQWAEANSDEYNQLIQYQRDNNWSDESEVFAKNSIDIQIKLETNPNLLIDIPCNQIAKWQALAQYDLPLSTITKISNLQNQNSSAIPAWDIQFLGGAEGALVNMDFFPITISQFPTNPNTNQPFTPQEFYSYFRQHLNQFTAGTSTTFVPSTITGVSESAIWNSANPLDAVISININPDSGSVICSNYTSNHWYFTTLTTPWAFSWSEDDYDGYHPVSGNREFGYYPANGSYVFYVRGVDRVHRKNVQRIARNLPGANSEFDGSDNLWNTMKQNLKNFVNNNGGIAVVNTNQIYRPNWNDVKDVLNGIKPLSDLGCD